ncbi:Adenine-specific methyltransferase (plasmid) [Borrelia hermsii YBT]|uniref:Adenine-specific methyltransferase n=1 Tax=Borrelia hermsii YBT TaxID=1313295 RepID=W5T1P9_BORHE|nr:hypothetical protein [Borrelia hermsii]AHH13170.1 Adenine-specific methyltransferase [Borrelia hermsii YBT]
MHKNIFQEYINTLKSAVIEDKTELTDRAHLEKLLDKLKNSNSTRAQAP